MAQQSLVGPPELHKESGSGEEQEAGISSGDAFMDLMVANFNAISLPGRLAKGFTKNNSPTYLSSGNPCLDFFFRLVPGTPRTVLNEKLRLSWDHDRLTTLKLVFNLRGVRGTGKSDKEGFYTAAIWLHRKHPETLAANLAAIAEFGCFKDLPEILYRLLEGPDVRRKQKAEWLKRKRNESNDRRVGFRVFRRRQQQSSGSVNGKRLRKLKSSVPRDIRVSQADERSKIEKEEASALRKKKRIVMAKKATERYAHDWSFRFLYEKISDYFAERLKADIELLKTEEYRKISLAAKWCPSLDSSFDRSTLLCESIAKKVFPRESYPEYEGIEEAHYAYRVRDRMRKQVLVPLRKALKLPEVYIGANQWSEIPYNRVPSVAMKFYKDKFLKHDGERFIKYLHDKNVPAKALPPRDIIDSLNDRDHGQVPELQWKRSIEDCKRGKLKNCLAVCDVSGSMGRTAMEVSLTLGLLVSEMSEDPWRGKIITFSESPKLHLVKGGDLRSKIEFMKKMEWGQKKKDLQKVFDLILDVAVAGGLREEQMIKRVFVFSDMEFDKASPDNWETNYDVIVRRFSEKGYRAAVPEIVFWNLRDSKSTPVPATHKGTALVSGFSKNLIEVFLDGNICGENFNPESVMEAAICSDEYQRLVLID